VPLELPEDRNATGNFAPLAVRHRRRTHSDAQVELPTHQTTAITAIISQMAVAVRADPLTQAPARAPCSSRRFDTFHDRCESRPAPKRYSEPFGSERRGCGRVPLVRAVGNGERGDRDSAHAAVSAGAGIGVALESGGHLYPRKAGDISIRA
jgi:hypothetical protein